MKFCPLCESRMTKDTVTGNIVFKCRCTKEIMGEGDDSLMSEGISTDSNAKYEVFIDNAAFDTAANKVLSQCTNCGLPYLTLIRVGINEQVMYVCRCGFKSTYENYKKV